MGDYYIGGDMTLVLETSRSIMDFVRKPVCALASMAGAMVDAYLDTVGVLSHHNRQAIVCTICVWKEYGRSKDEISKVCRDHYTSPERYTCQDMTIENRPGKAAFVFGNHPYGK
jgi:hypothetical protein